jgi:hypothetical protein
LDRERRKIFAQSVHQRVAPAVINLARSSQMKIQFSEAVPRLEKTTAARGEPHPELPPEAERNAVRTLAVGAVLAAMSLAWLPVLGGSQGPV